MSHYAVVQDDIVQTVGKSAHEAFLLWVGKRKDVDLAGEILDIVPCTLGTDEKGKVKIRLKR